MVQTIRLVTLVQRIWLHGTLILGNPAPVVPGLSRLQYCHRPPVCFWIGRRYSLQGPVLFRTRPDPRLAYRSRIRIPGPRAAYPCRRRRDILPAESGSLAESHSPPPKPALVARMLRARRYSLCGPAHGGPLLANEGSCRISTPPIGFAFG